jgi:hypothetical protein
MPDPVDAYADQFQITLGPYGSTLSFLVSQATPPPPGASLQSDRVATIRMSLEHLKVMTFLLRRQVVQYERDRAIDVQIPQEILNSLRIGLEDWQAFWRA